MKTVWLVNPYGPIEGEDWRTYSFNQFGRYLSNRNFKVIWWTANFAHHFKNYRSNGWKDIQVNENFIIRLVPTSSYKKNISIGRFKKDIVFAKNSYKKFKESERPDIIVSADNPLTMNYPTFKYAADHNIPVVYDQMDLWPEFIEKVAGKNTRKVLKILFRPVYRQRKKNYQQLAGVVALGSNYLKKAIEIEPTLIKKPQALIYNGIDVNKFREKLNNQIDIKNLPLHKEENEVWCVFAGTLGPSYDVETIIECAKIFNQNENNNIRFIVAGSGPLEGKVKEASKKLDNFCYIGKLLPEDLIPVYGKCDIGLSTYSANSNVDMPDKFYDYTAAGLAVVNSLQGEVREHIERKNAGINYAAGNIESFYNSIQHVSEKEKLALLKKNSYQMAIEFDENKQNRKLLEVINKVLEV
ncbi:hypothetical protein AV656_08295 [Bhargavaea cecembensis]|uniref:Glycosyltransferase WbuB n=1 Tax=Bhargavaea cecembensis TaxID=394098 RepID=A0A161STD3_9BACL|nr:glycosyltransferase family 4 protein [Bhargavaea cecembensis]KZE38890.1 hypothetical protein AV656_08295 [Bhargavaea cecembensis]